MAANALLAFILACLCFFVAAVLASDVAQRKVVEVRGYVVSGALWSAGKARSFAVASESPELPDSVVVVVRGPADSTRATYVRVLPPVPDAVDFMIPERR